MTEEESIVDGLEGQQLDLVDAVPLATVAPSSGTRRRRRPSEAALPAGATGEVDITVPLGPEESAVVLVERDGVYEWNVIGVEGPVPVPPVSAQRSRRRGTRTAAGAPAPTRTARFTIAVAPPAAPVPAASARRAKRRSGLVKMLGAGRVIAYVFRFVAKPILGGATRFMEHNVREGLVHITKPDPNTWTTLAEDAPVEVPSGRVARVLLLVHGTFSSTVGSFGALAGQADGRAFLEAALRDYDLVIGWDHRTLSALPTDNAVDLAARLERIGFPEAPQVDAIAFSRGGLVLRSLIEYVLPSSPLKLVIRRAVFVACTNGGAELARPANWHRFVDRYTNLATAGARTAAMLPGFAAAGTILASAIRGVGVFVKVLASSAVADRAIPGISAMDPCGDFVRDINGAQPGQPAPHETYYCAITSNFDPDTASTQSDPHVIPPALLLKLADKATDVLYGKQNDLVVHVESMTQIDEGVGSYVRERYDFGTNGTVHHCCYFSQPETASSMADWLEVPLGDGGARAVAPASQVVTLRSTLFVTDALARLEASSAPWIVVERPYTEGGKPVTLRYAHPATLGCAWLQQWRARPDATVQDAFELRETRRSHEAPVGSQPSHVPLEPGQSAAILSY